MKLGDCWVWGEDIAITYPHDEYLRKYYYGWFEGI